MVRALLPRAPPQVDQVMEAAPVKVSGEAVAAQGFHAIHGVGEQALQFGMVRQIGKELLTVAEGEGRPTLA